MDAAPGNRIDEPRVIELRLPADTGLLRVVRLSASALATTVGMLVEDLDELRIAVDEAVAALIEGGDGTRLDLRFDLDGGGIELHGSIPAGGPLDADRLELSHMLLAAVTDDHAIESVDGVVRVRFRKVADGAA